MTVEVWIHSFLNLGTRVKSMFDFTFRPLYPQERTAVPFKYVTGWAPQPVWVLQL